MSKKIHIITHNDLDGVASYLAVSWFLGVSDISYTIINNHYQVRNDILKFLSKDSFLNYDKVFVLDLDCYESKDLLEHKNVYIMDHHKTHVDMINDKGGYKKAHNIVKEYSSCCKLIYDIFSKSHSNTTLNKNQKVLIAICDDYDSYQLKLKYSLHLNWVFFSYNNRFDSFVKRFYNGFYGFNLNENNMIKIKKDGLASSIKSLEIYEGKINDYSVICTFSNDFINEIHDHLLKNYKTDLSIVVMPKTSKVTFRKQKEVSVKLNELADILCEGGGHEYAAGGKITERFMTLSKSFLKK